MEKMTNKQALEIAINALKDNAEMASVVEKLGNMKASLEKRATNGKKGESKVAKENLAKAVEVENFLKAEGKKMTVTEIIKGMGLLETYSTSKMTAILTVACKAKEDENGTIIPAHVVKEIEKGKSKYSYVG